jgi:hypothetical protein
MCATISTMAGPTISASSATTHQGQPRDLPTATTVIIAISAITPISLALEGPLSRSAGRSKNGSLLVLYTADRQPRHASILLSSVKS